MIIFFIRKKRLLKQIEAMVEDCEFHKVRIYKLDTDEHKQKRELFLAKQAELLDLEYWIKHGESIRPLYDRKRHFDLR